MNDVERRALITALRSLWQGWSDLRFGQLLRLAVGEDVRRLGRLTDEGLAAGVAAAARDAPGDPPPPPPYWDTEARRGRGFLNGLPRDPARIDGVLSALSAAWSAHPELTLAEVVELALNRGNVAENQFGTRALLIEDGPLRKLLDVVSADQ